MPVVDGKETYPDGKEAIQSSQPAIYTHLRFNGVFRNAYAELNPIRLQIVDLAGIVVIAVTFLSQVGVRPAGRSVAAKR